VGVQAAGAIALSQAATLAGAAVEAVLVILPAATGGLADLADPVVAGLPLARRIALAGARAGFGRIVTHAGDRDGTVPGMKMARPGSRWRFVLLPANVVPQSDWLRTLRSMPLDPEVLYVDEATTALVETTRPALVLSAVSAAWSAGELLATLRGSFEEGPWPADQRGRFPLSGLDDLPHAETWLLQNLIKASEGFMSRHFERRLSLALTRRLVRTRITPNAMTVVSVGIGLLGAPCFLSADPRVQLGGAVLFLAHSILDGCDGELARLKFLESRSGAVLDFWGDNLVHVAVFLSMAIGWSRDVRAPWPLAVGGLAMVATVAAAAALGADGLAHRARETDPSWVSRLTGALAHRDFIYLIVALAAAGKAWWFLALAAAGTPIFALLCLWARVTRRRA
jgi:phosphatidylglycerophosphate synthase